MRAGALALLWHPPVLFHYSFKSGIYAEKMVERISKEFDARPLSSPTEIRVNIARTMGRCSNILDTLCRQNDDEPGTD